jgi:hypothetical protein
MIDRADDYVDAEGLANLDLVAVHCDQADVTQLSGHDGRPCWEMAEVMARLGGEGVVE